MKLNNQIKWGAILALSLAPALSVAENSSSSDPHWDLPHLIARASSVSSEIKALERDIQSAEAKANQAGRWDNPVASLSAGPKSIGATSGSILQVGIQQNLPLFGKKSIEQRIGDQNRRVLESTRELETLEIRHEVVRLAYEYAAVTEQVKHINHRREGLKLVAQYLSSRPFASPSQLVEKFLIQNRVREIESLFLQVSGQKEKAWQALNVFLALPAPITPELRWYERTDTQIPGDPEASLEGSPELERQSRTVALSELSIEQAGKRAIPDFSLGASYTAETPETRENTYLFSLQFSIPILDRGGFATQAAQAQREAEGFRLEKKRRELTSRFSQAQADYEQARKRVELYPLSLVATLEAQFRKGEAGWKKTLVPTPAFLELESQVHDQIVRIFSTQVDYVHAVSELFLISGKDFVSTATLKEGTHHD